jgi:site-specific DNA recombinase
MDRCQGMPRHAAIYARQSRTTEGSASLSIQVDTCREVAARFGMDVAHELVEPPSTSGYKNRGRDRPQFLRLLELIDAGEVDAVVISNTDRLSRGGGVGWTPLLEAIERAGHDANRFILRPDGWLSEFELGIRSAIDREEASKTSARMRDVRAREAREGKPRPAPCRPYGYRYDAATKSMSIVVPESETLRECADRVLAGESPYSVAKDLNRRNIPTVTGTRWSTSVLISILQSARIAGLRSHLGEVVGPGQWDGIVTPEEHERLVALTANRHSHGGKRAPRTYPLVGFLKCGKCGKPLRSQSRKEGERRGRRYACRSTENLDGCGSIQIKAEFVEEAVSDYVIGTIADPDLRDRLLAAAPAPDDSTHREALAELRKIDAERQRLTDLAVEGVITAAEVRRKNSELDERTSRLHQQLTRSTDDAAIARLPVTVPELLEAWDDRGIDFQRVLIGLLIDHITVEPATRKGPGRFDDERLSWTLRA